MSNFTKSNSQSVGFQKCALRLAGATARANGAVHKLSSAQSSLLLLPAE
jgi:hypothetical protein